MRVGKDINRYKVAKHFELDIGDGSLEYRRKEDEIAQEAALDGIYVIRTSVTADRMSSCVRHYKALARVERAFRTLKSVDLRIRPHRKAGTGAYLSVHACLLRRVAHA